MCRFALYDGAPVSIADLLYAPEHSLQEQAIVPRQMLAARVNVDGVGVAWWEDGDSAPQRYRTMLTSWGDPNLPTFAPRTRSRRIMAHVRSATPGIPVGAAQVAPFVAEGLTFAHNGWLGGYRDGVGHELNRRLPVDVYRHFDAVSDSMSLFLTIVKHRLADPAGGLVGAVSAGVDEAIAVCADHRREATINLLVTEGEESIAVRAAHDHDANTLYVAAGSMATPHGTLVASEPLHHDDPSYEPMPIGTWVRVTDGAASRPERLDGRGGNARGAAGAGQAP